MFALDTLLYRLRHGCQTMEYPEAPAPGLPDRHGGALAVEPGKCVPGCSDCLKECPTEALSSGPGGMTLDLGKCLFCARCVEVCGPGVIRQTGKHPIAARARADLLVGAAHAEEVRLAAELDAKLKNLFGRSLRLRQVSAGGCNACEADINVLSTIGWDISRFGIQVVASPRHADGLLITGPISSNMELALRKTYEALPDPRLVIAVGTCAISGGAFAGNPQVLGGAEKVVPVDLYIPGCPPHPLTILDGLLRLLGRLPNR